MFKDGTVKKILIIIGAIVTAAATVTGIVVIVKKLLNKKESEKFYIECDCEEEKEELIDEPDCPAAI